MRQAQEDAAIQVLRDTFGPIVAVGTIHTSRVDAEMEQAAQKATRKVARRTWARGLHDAERANRK